MRVLRRGWIALLASTSPATQAQQPALQGFSARPDEVRSTQNTVGDADIFVVGQRRLGVTLGDTPPLVQLDPTDISAYGAATLTELLEALEPQTRGQGGSLPVVLLNGRRISSFSEIQDLPPEAVLRVDVLPEEVGLRYGYSGEQRVVNFVLRPRYYSRTIELEHGFATAGGQSRHAANFNLTKIQPGGRWKVGAEYAQADLLLESERQTFGGFGHFRSLLPATRKLSLKGMGSRKIFGTFSATVDARLDFNVSRSRLGPLILLGEQPDIGTGEAFTRRVDGTTGHLGTTIEGDIGQWQWTLVGNYDRSNATDVSDLESVDEVFSLMPRRERSMFRHDSAAIQLLASGSLLTLPGGPVSATFSIGQEGVGFRSRTQGEGFDQRTKLERSGRSAQAIVDIPLTNRNTGRRLFRGLSVNLNAELNTISDFGTLRSVGYGISWSPLREASLVASITQKESAPSVHQLGAALLKTPNLNIFDFPTGEAVLISRLDGGNPSLRGDDRRTVKIGLTVRPLQEASFSLNYTKVRVNNPISSFPTATPEIEAAFPERFLREETGRLIQIDARPLNFEEAAQDEIRWGINFSGPLGGSRAGREGNTLFRGDSSTSNSVSRLGAGLPPNRPGEPASPGGDSGSLGPSVDRRRIVAAAARNQGRVQFALFHTWRFRDRLRIREGVGDLNFLSGSALNNRGGRPQHSVELQGGLFRNGFGARFNANWQAGSFVRGIFGNDGGRSDLFFSDYATLDLKTFVNFADSPVTISWLHGARLTFELENVLNQHPRVRNSAGQTPVSYQARYLDPLGRAARVSFRKLF